LESRLPVRREALWWRKIRAGSQMPAQARGTAVGALGIETPAIERNFRGTRSSTDFSLAAVRLAWRRMEKVHPGSKAGRHVNAWFRYGRMTKR
jgi:hypothetical protein